MAIAGYEKLARRFGWIEEGVAHPDLDSLVRNGVVHPDGWWAPDWQGAVAGFQYNNGKITGKLN